MAETKVTDNELDYPRFWQEIGRTTLTSAGDTMTVSGLPSVKHMMLLIFVKAEGAGTIDVRLRFNNDSGANYDYRASTNGSADGTAVGQVSIGLVSTAFNGAVYITAYINPINTTQRAVMASAYLSENIGTAPTRREVMGKWTNTADLITRVDIYNAGTDNYQTNSEVVVLGHN